MEPMATCLDKLIKKLGTGIPERILGKMAVSVSDRVWWYLLNPFFILCVSCVCHTSSCVNFYYHDKNYPIFMYPAKRNGYFMHYGTVTF